MNPEPSHVTSIRALFISDLHLGSRFAQAGAILEMLKHYQPEMLYLVGDILDARVLQRRWYWPPIYNAILNRLAELAGMGTQIYYAPGNHDSFLRDVCLNPGPLIIQDSFVHHCVDGRRIAVMHGDQFDKVESRARWLSHLGSFAYESLIASDRKVNSLLHRFGMPPVRYSRFVKQSTKRIVQRLSGFEDRLMELVERLGCDGIVCGHIHVPTERVLASGALYVNLGDWIENSTALVEWPQGHLELMDFAKSHRTERHLIRNVPATPLPLSPSAARLASDLLTGWLGAAA